MELELQKDSTDWEKQYLKTLCQEFSKTVKRFKVTEEKALKNTNRINKKKSVPSHIRILLLHTMVKTKKTFSDKQELGEFVTSRPTLKEIVKEIYF